MMAPFIFLKKPHFYAKHFSTTSGTDIELIINSSVPILNRLSELCIVNFSGCTLEEGANLNRSALVYNHNNKPIKFDSRT